MSRNLHRSNLIEKLYGGLNMSWPGVVLFAVGAAVLTAAFLMIPAFRDTSFERMGVTLEAWFFFTILIMANCKRPLESALKTFVFFLISQPLIYLIQVPFSSMGWALFGYYRYWGMLTVLTFPMAFVGWYITRRDWLSVLILSPVLAYLGITAYRSGLHCIRHFPLLLITCLFCLLQIVLYLLAFLPGKKKLVGVAIPILASAILAFTTPQVSVDAANFLPDKPVLTDAAVVVMEGDPSAAVTIERTGEDSMVRVQATEFGSTDYRIRDGANEYLYVVEVFEDDGGHSQVRITPRQSE